MAKYVAPEVLHVEEIACLTDNELNDRLNALIKQRDRAAKTWDPTPWEIEICYTQREIDLRRTRYQLHTLYLQKLRETSSVEDYDYYIDEDVNVDIDAVERVDA